MKRWIQLAARMYPRAWRERYGDEFEGLLEDYNPGLWEFINVLGGALKMQITNGSLYWKAMAAMAVLGAVVAAVTAFSLPKRYQSTAVLSVPGSNGAPLSEVEGVARIVFSRGNLSAVICNPKFDLYQDVRNRLTLEDAIGEMQRNARISFLPPAAAGTAGSTAIKISFEYPDKAQSQAVSAELASEVVSVLNRNDTERQRMWKSTWPHEPPPAPRAPAALLDAASQPAKPLSPNVFALTLAGIAGGAAAGALAVFGVKKRKQALAYAAFGMGGAVLALAVAYMIPTRYTSTAVMLLRPAWFPERDSGKAIDAGREERFKAAIEDVSSAKTLAGVIQKLNLYPTLRAHKPLEDAVETMRTRDLILRRLPPTAGMTPAEDALGISFSYSDKYLAQKTVVEIIGRLTVSHFTQERVIVDKAGENSELANLFERGLGDQLELLDPASLPQNPVSPNRLLIVIAGMAIGLLLCALTPKISRKVRQRRTSVISLDAA